MAIPKDILIEAQKLAPKQAVELFEKKGIKVTATAAETEAAVKAQLFAVTRSVNMAVKEHYQYPCQKGLDREKNRNPEKWEN